MIKHITRSLNILLSSCILSTVMIMLTVSATHAQSSIIVSDGNIHRFVAFRPGSSLYCYLLSSHSGVLGNITPYPISRGASVFRRWSTRKTQKFEVELQSAPNNDKFKAKQRKNPLYKGISYKKFKKFESRCESFKFAEQTPLPTATSTITPTPTETSTPTITPTPTATPTPPITDAVPNIELSPLVSGLSAPLYLTHSNDASDRLFIVQQGGQIIVFKNGLLLPTPFLDIDAKTNGQDEQGLLSAAFHPKYAENGRFFINYTDLNGDTVVSEFRVSANNPDLANPNSERVVLTVDQPAPNHNGGLLKFGPDGYLYIAMGDGGGGGDPFNNGQNLGTLHGSLLRINVDGALPYAVPSDNPFVNIVGALPEIWAYGLRNPWRFSFDRSDGRLFLADVGQGAIEEVDLVSKGDNLGWNIMEGSSCFNPPQNCDTTGLKLPIAEYSHAEGRSITGGYVYRGASFPDLYGKYIFGDFITRRIWVLIPLTNGTWRREFLTQPGNTSIASFGEDQNGNLYLVAYQGTIYRIIENLQ